MTGALGTALAAHTNQTVTFAEPEMIPAQHFSHEGEPGSLGRSVEAAHSIEAFKTERAFTPKIKKADLVYVDAKDRRDDMLANSGTLNKPNYEDILRRVSIVVSQHIEKCESRV